MSASTLDAVRTRSVKRIAQGKTVNIKQMVSRFKGIKRQLPKGTMAGQKGREEFLARAIAQFTAAVQPQLSQIQADNEAMRLKLLDHDLRFDTVDGKLDELLQRG